MFSNTGSIDRHTKTPKLSCAVIIAAYNNFSTLQKALWGYEAQTHQDFTIIIADDGSNARFADQLNAFAATSSLQIQHVWHADEGFRKCAILNKAIRVAQTEYLIFSDADIIPRNDFVANHLHLAHRGIYLTGSGGHINIPMSIHEGLTEHEVKSQAIFTLSWWCRHHLHSRRNLTRLAFRGAAARLCDALTPRRDAFVGCNASAFRNDVLAVKGFDETLLYGGLDHDLGIRLANHGIHGVRHKYSLCCVHLQHPRPYRDEAIVRMQRQLFRERKATRTVMPAKGIEDE